ncbi:hypothetical protein MJ923_05550 [Shewanella sp. 3B26]|uniref:Uncharacterized protein n=1 Tax=Shewanella zhuhaiensis TaxID=2919576 RepID=A0AAJ1EZ68_9GAMM|nr:hypothetical protein [Shewanella zhuhaiensis]MCH4293766.1 hypothetical protein [Shewanella zhuhaiensis]
MKLSGLLENLKDSCERTQLVFSSYKSQQQYSNIAAVDWDEDDFYFIPEGWEDCFSDSIKIANLNDLTVLVLESPQLQSLNVRVRSSNKWAEEGTAISSNSLVLEVNELNENLFNLIHESEASTLTFKGVRNIKYVQSD